MPDHRIIVHAYQSDFEGDEHYIDDAPDPTKPVLWTAYERIIPENGDPHDVPWDGDFRSRDDAIEAAKARAAEVGLSLTRVSVEHDEDGHASARIQFLA